MSILLNPKVFPAFRKLPPDNRTLLLWEQMDAMGILPPVVDEATDANLDLDRHWCYMGQIVVETYCTDRDCHRYRCVIVCDREGIQIPIHFHLQPDDPLDTSRLKIGSTVFVLYAKQHWLFPVHDEKNFTFESSENVLVVNRSLKAILGAARSLGDAEGDGTGDHHKEADKKSKKKKKKFGENNKKKRGDSGLRCKNCLKSSSSSSSSGLMPCDKCQKFWYCSKACQTEDWPVHRSVCEVLVQIAPVTEKDYRSLHHYEDFFSF